MIELAALQLAETVSTNAQPLADPTADAIHAAGGAGLSLGAVWAAKAIGTRAVMGYFLPDDVNADDLDAATTERDPRALAIGTVLYALATAVTTAAAYDATASLAVAGAWSGACLFVGAALALAYSRDASPVGHIRLLAATRRKR